MGMISAIGPSTGYLFAKVGGASLTEHMIALKAAGATAVEMVVGKGRERIPFMLAGEVSSVIRYTSLHLGSLKDYPEAESDLLPAQAEQLDEYKAIYQQHNIQTLVFHPDIVPPHAYGMLRQRGMRLAMENMDRHKPAGKTLAEIDGLWRQYPDRSFVLDLQHAYEISKDSGDNGIGLAVEFARVMRMENVPHLHVSGELEKHGEQVLNHAQLHMATNRRQIIEALSIILHESDTPLPIILEGQYLLRIPDGYVPSSEQERFDLLYEAAEDMRRERECLLNELKDNIIYA